MIPWYVKIPAKIALSRLPISPRAWQRLNLFRAGVMDDEQSARSIFLAHLRATGLSDLVGRTVLELGPGNGLLTGKFACGLGAARTWLIDACPLAEPASFSNTTYLTDGLSSLRTIPSSSVDFLFSNAVLEHIRLAEFEETISEMKRILKSDGIASHQIDFRDHLGGALNNLRFSVDRWESPLMANSGFYTNRIPWPKMEAVFIKAGFMVKCLHTDCWPSLPTPKQVMADPYSSMPTEELLVWGCHCLLSAPLSN